MFSQPASRLGLGLISLLIEDLHSIHTTIYKIQLVRYFCCFSNRSKGSGKKVLLENLLNCLNRHTIFTKNPLSVLSVNKVKHGKNESSRQDKIQVNFNSQHKRRRQGG